MAGPTSIYFNGRLISIPGSYTEVDASGLEVVGLGATGIVACIGQAIGGKPWNAVGDSDVKTNLQVATTPQQPFNYFRSGDLLEAAPLLFSPANDTDIPGGAQEVVFVKTNPATQSSAAFANTDGEALVLTSEDWGFFTTQINVVIAAGTVQGKKITITFEDTIEAFDDVGGDTYFSLIYLSGTPADGFLTITGAFDGAYLTGAFTRANAGLDGDVSNQAAAGEVIELVSDNAGDTDIVVEIVGTDDSDLTQRERVTLNGVTAVDTVGLWNSFHGARIVSGTAAGTITLSRNGAGLAITTLTAGAPTKGLEPCVDMSADKQTALAYVADGATTARVTVVGLSTGGAIQTETVQLNGTTSVPGTAKWSRIDYLAVGELAAARTLTISGNAFKIGIGPAEDRTTLQKAADQINTLLGMTMTLVTSSTQFLLKDLDHQTASDMKSPTTLSFKADLWEIINKINNESALVTAARGSVGSGPPDNTSSTVYLAGGHEGSATPGQEDTPTSLTTDWQGALDLLTKVRVNTIVVMTHAPAIHALVKTHCQYMGGAGRSERDAIAGIQNAGDTAYATKAEVKSQIVDLNTRHIRVWAQGIERFNTSGAREVLPPKYGSCLIAGAQAGSPVGTPLTHKYLNTLSLKQDSSWNPTDDAEEMIQAGLCFGEVVDGIGRRVVRNITTHLTDSTIAYVEASANEATNYSVYTFRTAMERIVGQAGFAGTVQAANGVAVNQLGLLVGVALVAYRSLTITLTLDVLEVGVEMAPVLPINFVKTTVHLVSIPQSAAAA